MKMSHLATLNFDSTAKLGSELLCTQGSFLKYRRRQIFGYFSPQKRFVVLILIKIKVGYIFGRFLPKLK
jgi:hypothetical protein